MKTKFFTVALLTVLLTTAPALAQKKPEKGVAPQANTGVLFSPQAYALEPSIEAALKFTDDQNKKIGEILTATIQAPALQELAKKTKKGDPDAEANAEKYKAEREKALAEFKKQITPVLTAEQKATIAKVDEAVKKVLDSTLNAEQKEALAQRNTKKTKKPE